MDSSTGLLLMAVPATTLSWMGIRDIPAELAYVRLIGAFVAAVGSIYFLPFVRGILLEDVLTVTALVRIVVGAFVGVAVVWRCARDRLGVGSGHRLDSRRRADRLARPLEACRWLTWIEG